MRVIIVVLLVFFSSCDKACINKSAASSSSTTSLEAITYLEVNGRIQVELIEDTSSFIVINGIPEFHENIVIEQSPESLKISLDQSCGILNNPEQIPSVQLSLPQLNHIYFSGTDRLFSESKIKRDSLQIECWNSSGDINLDLEVDKLDCANHIGTSDIYLKGAAGLCYLFSGDIGFMFLKELEINGLYLNHDAIGDVEVKVLIYLEAEINSSGNLYYAGSPKQTKISSKGEGEVFILEN